MPRTARNAPGGPVYHVLNRANGRLRLFKKGDSVNSPPSEAEEKIVRESIARSRPAGNDPWMRRMAKMLGLDHTLRPRGPPRRMAEESAIGGGIDIMVRVTFNSAGINPAFLMTAILTARLRTWYNGRHAIKAQEAREEKGQDRPKARSLEAVRRLAGDIRKSFQAVKPAKGWPKA